MLEPYELEFCPVCKEVIVDDKGEPQLCTCNTDKIKNLVGKKSASGRNLV